jgi:hypothetical protein
MTFGQCFLAQVSTPFPHLAPRRRFRPDSDILSRAVKCFSIYLKLSPINRGLNAEGEGQFRAVSSDGRVCKTQIIVKLAFSEPSFIREWHPNCYLLRG